MTSVAFFYDFVCPYAFFASREVDALADAASADLERVPMLLGGVFRSIGSPDVPMHGVPAAKAAYMKLELERSARRAGVVLSPPEGHPRRTVLALRAAIASSDLLRASRALYDAYWLEGRDLEQEDEVRAVLDRAGLDGAKAVEDAASQRVKDMLRANTERAVAEGVFGAPAFVVTTPSSRELHWGWDRMDFVQRALTGSFPVRSKGPVSTGRSARFYFDYSSPFAYLASTQIQNLASGSGASIELRPLLLGGLFREIGTPDVPLFEMPEAKRKHMLVDLDRWAERWRVPFRFPSRFPMNTVKALRLTMTCPEAKRFDLVRALFDALWVDDRDLADERELRSILTSLSLDADELCSRMDSPETKTALRAATAAAKDAGVFGVPTFEIDGELHWGQDRVERVVEILGAPTV